MEKLIVENAKLKVELAELKMKCQTMQNKLHTCAHLMRDADMAMSVMGGRLMNEYHEIIQKLEYNIFEK